MTRIGYNTGNSAHQNADESEQLQQFVLLTHILKDAGLTAGEVIFCMKKYVATLSKGRLVSLTQHLPNATDIGDTWQLTDENIAQLSRQGKMSAAAVADAARNAKLQFVQNPQSGHGHRGWLRELLHILARHSTTTRTKDSWAANPDSAIWLAIMSRARIILSNDEWTAMVPQSTRDSYRNGWLLAFGLHRNAIAGIPVLTQEYFALQTGNAAYLAMLRELTRLAASRALELCGYDEVSWPALGTAASKSKPKASPVQLRKEWAVTKEVKTYHAVAVKKVRTPRAVAIKKVETPCAAATKMVEAEDGWTVVPNKTHKKRETKSTKATTTPRQSNRYQYLADQTR